MKPRILLDTSVWVECRTDEEIKKVIEILANKFEIRSSEKIDDELEDAYNFLRKKRMRGADEVKQIYYTCKKATIKLTEFVKKVARAYAEEGRKLRLPIKEMEADFAIVAAASADAVDFILTLNRKTMASEHAQATYAIVNSRLKLRTPQFLTDKISFRRLSYA